MVLLMNDDEKLMAMKAQMDIIDNEFKPMKDDMYTKVQSVLDFISNMTDLYAVQLYKDLRGME